MYTDGAVKMDAIFAAPGGVTFKQDGEWVLGFNRNLGLCAAFDTKLWGILEGLTLIHERGYQKVMIHTNNLEGLTLILSLVTMNSLEITRFSTLRDKAYSNKGEPSYGSYWKDDFCK